MTADIDRGTLEKAYARWAPVYDLVFGRVFNRGRQAAIAAAERVGGRILEVGIGTGLSLSCYSMKHRIVGIDLSEPMLNKARQRAAELPSANVESLEVMDAEHLAFADASFDAVVASLVISTVPYPEQALDECSRVLRPGGELILVSRIGADRGLRLFVERALQPAVRRLGWRTDFPWDRYVRWLQKRPGMRLAERRPLPPFGHFCLLRFAKSTPQAEAYRPPQNQSKNRSC